MNLQFIPQVQFPVETKAGQQGWKPKAHAAAGWGPRPVPRPQHDHEPASAPASTGWGGAGAKPGGPDTHSTCGPMWASAVGRLAGQDPPEERADVPKLLSRQSPKMDPQ